MNNKSRKKPFVVNSSDISPRPHQINRDQSTLETEKFQLKRENKTSDFNAAKSKFGRKSYSPSLQRRKWTETQNRMKEHQSNNQWNSREKTGNYRRQGTYSLQTCRKFILV